MFQEIMKMMGEVEIIAKHPDGEIFATRKIVNLVTTSGKRLAAMMLNTCTDNGARYLCLGSNSTAIGPNTNVIAEYTTGGTGLVRAIATTSNTITTTSGDTAQWTNIFTSNVNSQAVGEEAIAQGSATTSYLAAVQTFAAITLNSADTLSITHKISFA